MQPSSEPRPSDSEVGHEYSEEEGRQLLALAHESILAAVQGRGLPELAASEHLSQPRGAFTTLYLQGKLRGCVGYPNAILPLYRTVAETARAAAFDDSRFAPVSSLEAQQLTISLSILSPLRSVAAADVRPGRDGLVISFQGRRGLLLPQVAIDHGWDRVKFLEQTCRKAGLPPDAWQHGASIEAFTAEVFSEAEVPKP
jgi:AmmeMemoRadiSam system protein A